MVPSQSKNMLITQFVKRDGDAATYFNIACFDRQMYL